MEGFNPMAQGVMEQPLTEQVSATATPNQTKYVFFFGEVMPTETAK
jgi:hypothetical protein